MRPKTLPLLIALLLGTCAFGQSTETAEGGPKLQISFDHIGGIRVELELSARPINSDRLIESMESALGCDPEMETHEDEDGGWRADAWCADQMHQEEHLFRGVVDLEAIREALKDEEIQSIRWIIWYPTSPGFAMEPVIAKESWQPGWVETTLPVDNIPSLLTITFGFSQAAIVSGSAILIGAILFFPLVAAGLGLYASRTHSRFARHALHDLRSPDVLYSAFYLWLICFAFSELYTLPVIALGSDAEHTWIVFIGPIVLIPFVMSALCSAIANANLKHLGASAETTFDAVLRVTSRPLQVVGAMFSLNGGYFVWYGLTSAIPVVVVGVVALTGGTLYRRRMKRLSEKRLAPGPLLEKLKQLAKQADTVVTQLELVPSDDTRFADIQVTGHRVAISDDLPRFLSDRQFDAFALYRLIYSKRIRGSSRTVAWLVSMLLTHSAASWFISASAPDWLPTAVFMATVAINYVAVAYYFDRIAESRAAQLCSDPDALIGAELRVLQFVFGQGPKSTYLSDSTRLEIGRVAKRAGLSSSRVEELLGAPVTNSLPQEPAPHEPAGRIFDDEYNRRANNSVASMFSAVAFWLPVAVIVFASWVGLSGSLLLVCCGLAAVIGTLTVLALSDREPFSGLRKKYAEMRRKLEGEGIAAVREDTFVVGL